MFKRIEYREADFQPTAVGSDQTKALFSVKKGDRVIWASLRAQIAAAASTDTTVTLGDGSDPDGFIAAVDLEATAAGSLVDGEGAYLGNSGGKLYTADDTVDIVYAGSTYGATNPKVKVKIALVREWP